MVGCIWLCASISSTVALLDCGVSSDREGWDKVSPEATAYSYCFIPDFNVWNSNCLLLHVSGNLLATEIVLLGQTITGK